MKLTKDTIFSEMQNILEKLFELDKEDVTADARLYEDLDLDSIDAVDLIVHLQKTTGHKFKPEEFKSVKTVSDVIEIISKELNI